MNQTIKHRPATAREKLEQFKINNYLKKLNRTKRNMRTLAVSPTQAEVRSKKEQAKLMAEREAEKKQV